MARGTAVTNPALLHAGELSDSWPLHWILRVACASEFVGHGAFGIITKAAWLPYFGAVGIPPELGWKMMPIIGSVDISLGLIVAFVRPARAVLLYMTFWGLATASVRLIAAEPVWEFVERVPNWAIPMAFLFVRGWPKSRREWLE